jgi:Zn-dependent peptidase ImmA (M78 family)/O-acetyl-ADP-ribose deacetylase (regulator of RNase III)
VAAWGGILRTMVTTISWTHPSVVAFLKETGSADPVAEVERRAQKMALKAIEEGWEGPPYDPFELAERLGVIIVAREELEDARLVSEGRRRRIEFNPQRRRARTRFSIAHELGHLLFPDHGDKVRYRDASHRRERVDAWQLELLCNIAAAEFLMPAGAFPQAPTVDLSLAHLLDLRAKFAVSTEALLRRVVKLTGKPVALFAAARLDDRSQFRVDYVVGSRAWSPQTHSGTIVDDSAVLRRCTAVGFSEDGDEEWQHEALRVQAVGVPPYPQERFPRIIGLLQPSEAVPDRQGLRYVRGDATEPRVDGATILAHIVNNQARQWGGRGLARELADRYPDVHAAYRQWASTTGNRRLGAVHVVPVDDHLSIASMVAQAGYGESREPRLRLGALRRALETLASQADDAAVHMPLIGTGQGGMSWALVRDLVLEELCDSGIEVVVYVLPGAPMPDEEIEDRQLTLS